MIESINFSYKDNRIDKFNYNRHSHGKQYEIVLVHKGSGSFLVRDHIFPLLPGCIYFINGIETHCTIPDKGEEYVRSRIIINTDILDEFVEKVDCGFLIDNLFGNHGGVCITPDKKCIDRIDSEFRNINKYIEENPTILKFKYLTAITNILISANENLSYTPKPADLHKNKRISEILNYINSNLTAPLTINSICENVHLSRYYLCHTFKKYVGMSIFEYILSLRLAKAEYYLMKTDIPISQIVELSGFSSFSYFGRIFKETKKCSPREFRISNRK